MRAGFSLIEMSVVLLIISIVAASGLSISQSVSLRSDYDETEELMDELVVELQRFYSNNTRLPCPAETDLKLGDSNFGRELYHSSTDTCVSNTAAVTGITRDEIASTGRFVRIGSVPTRSLKLSDRAMKDEFQNRFTYAVVEDMTDILTSDTAVGEITINDGTGTDILTDAVFVIFSHGDDTKGAISFQAAASSKSCSGSDLDVENCDGDEIFTDTIFNSESGSSGFFDDIVIWLDKARL